MASTDSLRSGEQINPTELSQLVTDCRSAQDRGRDWLLTRIEPDGKPVGIETRQCCRLPWTLAVVGEREAAGATLGWLERRALTPSGDLQEGTAREGFVTSAATYGLAIIAMGAAYLERDDLVVKIMGTVRPWQDSTTGGAYSERPEARESSRQDLHDTAQLGFTALTIGGMEIAEGAYRWIRQLYLLQPDLPRRLFTRTTPEGLLTTPSLSLEWGSIVDFTKPRQAFFNPGLVAAFLARYALRMGDLEARELGAQFLALSANGTEAQFDYGDSKQICKFGWGAALMDTADPSGGHLQHVVHMARWFIDCQLPDGRWQNSAFLSPNPTEGDDQEITAEFVLHLGTILTALGIRLGRAGAQRATG